MKIRTVVIDDEPLALKLVTGYIRKVHFMELCGAFDNPMNAMDYLNEGQVDLLFLDIQMPDLTGIEFAKIMKNGPMIIFTTAFEKYALEGFRVDAVDYLLKPFSFEEFLNSAQKAKKLFDLENKTETVKIEANNEFLFLKSEYKIRRINFNDILYIEGLKDYIKVFLQNEPKPILSLNSMKSVEAKLPPEKFMRVHRSFIVNLEKIHTIERFRIVFNNERIPISDQYKDKFQEFLDKNFI